MTAIAALWCAAAAAAPASTLDSPASRADAGAEATRGAVGADRPAEAVHLHALFDEYWEEQMKAYPEWATSVGDHRYGDRLHDASPAAIAAEFAEARRLQAQSRAIDRDALPAADRTSLDVFLHVLDEQVRSEPLVGFRSMTLRPTFGFPTEFASVLQASPMAGSADAEKVLARLAAYPTRIDQEIALLREGLRLGWVPPREVLARVTAQLDGQLTPTPDDSPFFEPFERLPRELPAPARAALQARARAAITTQIGPALRRLRDFVADEYLPAAPAVGGLSTYPGGAAVYAEQIRVHTTTTLSAEQIHAIGLRETERLRREMEAAMRDAGYTGDFKSYVAYLHSDPKFFHTSPAALLAGYRDIAKRIDPELPRLFAVLPRATYGVRAMADHFDADTAESYTPPALDGSTPGWFEANAKGYAKKPIWSMETLVAHEAVPGHHLQIARAAELGELPRFRRVPLFTSYSEGWALYAETLGFDVGLYKQPASRFGHLQEQAWRAARLVVDTGIHAFGWSRQRAIDYMVERVGLPNAMVASEVDRYTSWPGQALAYTIGELKIIELRDRAKAKLGDRFDIRRFHRVVLDFGAVPLPVLERTVDEWLARPAGTP